MQVTRATFIPLLISSHSDRVDPSAVRDEGFADLTVVYTHGPDFGRRLVTHADLDHLQLHPRMLRQSALQHLEVLSSRAEFHGQPPALMLSFEGLESSLLLASDFWTRLEGAVPGELVVGVPARDVVVVTGSQSGPGLEKAKRCVERVFFAGGDNLISRGLLVRRGGTWEPFDRAARPSGRPTFGPAHLHGVGQPPRQFQEHPSWPGERIPPQAGQRPGMPGRHAPVRRRPMPGMAPASLDQTGSHRLDHTGSHRFDQFGPGRVDQTGPQRLDQTGSHRLDQTGSHRLGMTGQQPAYRDGGYRQPEPGYRDYAADVAEAAQYSVVPYPPGARPDARYDGARYDDRYEYDRAAEAMPYSAVPYSAVPYSAAPAGYARDGYTTGSMPRVDYPEYAATGGRSGPEYGPAERSRAGQPGPAYPSSWGSGPESANRSEFPTGPRSRFS